MTRYDLTHPLTDGMPVYPGDPAVSVSPAATMAADGYRVTGLALSTHSGTHVDAPSHLLADGRGLDAYDVGTFAMDAHLVGVEAGPREAITPDALPADDSADVVVLRTGFDAHWGTPRYRDHPYLAPETADALAERGQHVALDAASPDPSPPTGDADGEPEGYPAHRALFEAGLLVFENLRGLDALPSRFRLTASPLRVEGDGAPVRAVAVVED
ncbi:cyclase family protein [Halarchaeum sp. CBA1220]|uniref:cyclase family protein n=1 Tax=Halarchaeum sp. CBA1220 TaxID=1853682 RepID=UPI000F3A8CF5|nr:cyclase family protein [Halarchaeum sp. CBA1220]QLC34192.1 cyclase family protein [Halarchaeum sp. CBA1220]